MKQVLILNKKNIFWYSDLAGKIIDVEEELDNNMHKDTFYFKALPTPRNFAILEKHRHGPLRNGRLLINTENAVLVGEDHLKNQDFACLLFSEGNSNKLFL